MAECVFKRLEAMLPEFEDFDRLGLFSNEEAKKLLKKRTTFEYMLQKRIVEKKDYLKYIEYELNVDCLQRKRMMQMGIKRKQTSTALAVSKRIHVLFQQALRKFSMDLKLWMQYIDYCKQTDSMQLLAKSFGRLVQLFPHQPSVWILAAKWEFEDNGDVDNARSMLQRAIRLNQESTLLWKELFRLELLHVDKIKQRRKLLGIDAIGVEDDVENASAEFLENKTALIVHDQATKEFEGNIEMRLAMTQVCLEIPETENVQDEICNKIRDDFKDSSLAHCCLARRHIDIMLYKQSKNSCADFDEEWVAAENLAQRDYEQCMEKFSTDITEVRQHYVKSFLDLAKHSRTAVQANRRICHVLSVFENANKKKQLSEQDFIIWACLLEKINDVPCAVTCLGDGIKQFPSSAILKVHLLELKLTTGTPLNAIAEEFYKLSHLLKEEQHVSVWERWIETNLKDTKTNAIRAFEAAISVNASSRESFCVYYMEWLYENSGIKSFRKLYKRLIKDYKLSIQFHEKCLEIELSQGEQDSCEIREIFRLAIEQFGETNMNIWLKFMAFERPTSSPSELNAIYWRAIKTLQGQAAQDFIERHSLEVETTPPG